jgi:glycosyltransferase involved in cell wall biosynthesis
MTKKSTGMKILWFTWKDRSHPRSGGAEVVNEEIGKRLARDGHEVIFLVAGFEAAKPEETRDGYKIIRLGNNFTVYWEVYKYYKKNFKGWADVVIEEVNTVPFFTKLYVHPVKSTEGGAEQFNRVKEKRVYLFYQLCREIWFYQMSFPLNILGYLSEPLYLRMLASDKNLTQILTESESTKKDLARYGFDEKKISVFPIATHIYPVANLSAIAKYDKPTLLSLGAIREMKRTAHQIRAFEIAKKSIPDLQMKIAGDASSLYGKEILKMIAASLYKNDIEYLGKVNIEQKIELMQKSHIISVTSVKEGWGLIVTEANSQGTPAVVYDVDGLRDSVRNGETGIIVAKNTPEDLAEGIISLLRDPEKYARIRRNAWQWSQEFDFEKSYTSVINKLKEAL